MSDSGPGRREVAYRLFATEFDDAELSYSESDEERAPNYVVTPTGARVNRLFAVGVLTEVEDVNPEMVRGRLVDPTGAFVTYAGQYQPDALAALERAEPPAFFSISGKARTYEPDDGDRIYSSVRPETVSGVDADTRDRWVVTAAERTLDRIGVMASAIDSGLTGDPLRAALAEAAIDERLADGVALAVDHYGTTPEYLSELRRVAIEAVEVVAGERDEVRALDLAPGEGGGDAAALATVTLSGASTASGGTATGGEPEAAEPAAVDGSAVEGGSTPDAGTDAAAEDTGAELEPEIESLSEPGTEVGAEPETGTDTSAASDPGTDGRAEPEAEADPGATPEPTGDGPDAEPGTEPDTGVRSGSEPTAGGAEPAGDAPTSEPDEAAATEPGEFDPGEFELDEEERREVEEEYGTEFSTADEVEPADIEPEADAAAADPDDAAEAETGAGTAGADEGTAEPAVEPESGGSGGEDDVGEVDLDEAVVELMGELDDGDGAPRDELVAAATEEFGATAEAVEEAIQNALMGGQCYEPDDDTLKRI